METEPRVIEDSPGYWPYPVLGSPRELQVTSKVRTKVDILDLSHHTMGVSGITYFSYLCAVLTAQRLAHFTLLTG